MLTLLIALPVAVLHVSFAVLVSRVARKASARPAWWAWIPILNVVLPLRIAGRSLAWAIAFLLPPLNVAVWTLTWVQVCARLGRSPRYALAMPIPILNLAALARLAGLGPAGAVAVVGALTLSLAVAVTAQGVRSQRRLVSAAAALEQPDPGQRLQAIADLGRRPGHPAAALLVRALCDADAGVREEAARTLGDFSPDATAALGALSEAIRDSEPTVRGTAARAAWVVGRGTLSLPAAIAVPALLESVRGSGGRLLPDAPVVDGLAAARADAVPHLVAGLQDPDAAVRWHAAAALLRLGRTSRTAASSLLVAMNDPEWSVRNAAGRALEDVADEAALPALVAALRDPSAETRYHAARALGRVVPRSAAVPALVAALRDEDWEVRMEAAWALSAAGQGARDAGPALAEALRDDHPQVRAAVAWSLGSVGGGPAARAALEARIEDEDHDVRQAVAGVLRKMRAGQ